MDAIKSLVGRYSRILSFPVGGLHDRRLIARWNLHFRLEMDVIHYKLIRCDLCRPFPVSLLFDLQTALYKV